MDGLGPALERGVELLTGPSLASSALDVSASRRAIDGVGLRILAGGSLDRLGSGDHLHAPLRVVLEPVERLEQHVALALEHLAYLRLAVVDGAQSQRDHGPAAQRLVQDALVAASGLLEPLNVVEVVEQGLLAELR